MIGVVANEAADIQGPPESPEHVVAPATPPTTNQVSSDAMVAASA